MNLTSGASVERLLSLDNIRGQLIRLEDTIIFRESWRAWGAGVGVGDDGEVAMAARSLSPVDKRGYGQLLRICYFGRRAQCPVPTPATHPRTLDLIRLPVHPTILSLTNTSLEPQADTHAPAVLIERGQFAYKKRIYETGAFKSQIGWEGSWLEWFLFEIESFHGESAREGQERQGP